ncbi:hypothetical protein V1517DRAFT_317011 [Lipomyces orientalis]|uniref:Uncharacterized protein n=1 Tax=Lipomyces orientalis TaxID=1233043 RepID=A0ACC3TUM5_9ASCO
MPKKRHSSSQNEHQHGRGGTNGYGKPNGRRNGKQQGDAKKGHGTDRWSEERGQRRAFSMRDEALYTMRHHSLIGEDANNSPTTRSAVTFVKSAGLPGYDIAAKKGQRMRGLESPRDEGENSSADELYNELLDEEDELVESTRHLSVVGKADSAIGLDSRSDSSNQAADGVTTENDVENMPDNMLFMADDVKQNVDVPLNDEIVFAPRHIRLSASGVRLPARPLDLNISAPIVPKIVDESVHIEVAADKVTLAQRASVTATSSKKQKKKKTNKRKPHKASFPYKALIDDDDGDPLDDYIQNLYDDGILDESLEEVNPAGGIVEDDENVTSTGEDGEDVVQQEYVAKISDANLSDESSHEHREIQIETVDDEDGNRDDNNDGDDDNDEEVDEDEDGDEDEDDSEDDDEDDDEDEQEDDEDGDFDMGQDDYDYGDDDDILESERRFAEAEFMDITIPKKMKRMPEFDISDEELEHQLKSQWLKDKAAKKDKKKERELLRREGLLGKKARKGTRDLNAKYSRGMRVSDIKSEIETFLRNDGQTTLSLPPMDKNSRKAVHVLAAAYHLSSKSIGGGTQRFTILFKNSRSYWEADFGTLSIVEDRYYLPRLDKKASKIPTKDYSKRGTGSFRHRDGDVVGSNAPEIDSDNRGRQLLEKMGWVSGSGLGVAGNVGMSSPIMAKVKTSKAGLG